MDTPVILVGRRRGQPQRDRNWRLARARWEQLDWPIFEGYHETDGPYSMSAASNAAAADAGMWSVCLYVGADFVLQDLSQAEEAVAVAERMQHLTFAHDHLTLLTEEETQAYERTGILASQETRHPNTFSGVLAVPRSAWDDVRGFDERFIGWGWEDIAFWAACSTLHGFSRVVGDMFHLYHPPGLNEQAPEYPNNDTLGRRYLDARNKKGAMRRLISER